jgi:DNA-directed RNA polymerase sigma subunit (sigma70/sigma32)
MEALSWRYGLLDEDASTNMETPQVRANRYFSEAEQNLFGAAKKKKALVKKANVVKKGRFGEAMTFNEVGNKMQVSAEYTRKLCHAALAKLRRAADEGRLEPALLI